jgi:hypothetical protein
MCSCFYLHPKRKEVIVHDYTTKNTPKCRSIGTSGLGHPSNSTQHIFHITKTGLEDVTVILKPVQLLVYYYTWGWYHADRGQCFRHVHLGFAWRIGGTTIERQLDIVDLFFLLLCN